MNCSGGAQGRQPLSSLADMPDTVFLGPFTPYKSSDRVVSLLATSSKAVIHPVVSRTALSSDAGLRREAGASGSQGWGRKTYMLSPFLRSGVEREESRKWEGGVSMERFPARKGFRNARTRDFAMFMVGRR